MTDTPDKATLLAIAEVFQKQADMVPRNPSREYAQALGKVADEAGADRAAFFVSVLAVAEMARAVSAALRDKAGKE